jgi:hypothetical protein
MPTDWCEEEYGAMTRTEREAAKARCCRSESLVPPQKDPQLTNRIAAESLPIVGYIKWNSWFVGWELWRAALTGVATFFFLEIAIFGILGTALAVAGIVAAIGLAHYLLWERVFAQHVARETQPVQDKARRLETKSTEPPDEFLLGLNNRERVELLQLLEHSSEESIEGQEEIGDRAAIRRELGEKIRRFGVRPLG